MINPSDQYATLRQEALDTINSRDNFIIAMYTITVAILCAAFELENTILFLLPYIVIFAFQQNIANKTENMIVLGSYIAVFLEEGDGWESNNFDLKNVMQTSKEFPRPKGIMAAILGRVGSRQLGLWCSLSCVIYSIAELVELIVPCDAISPTICISLLLTRDSIMPVACIVLSVVLYVLLRIQTKNALNTYSRRAKYIQRLKEKKNQKPTVELATDEK